jgi:DNA-binding LacI/PurR family transcriptional regulator
LAATGPGICARGYYEALAAAGIDSRPEYERTAAPDPASGAAAVDGFFELSDAPTAIVVGSDAQAIGVLQRARALGRRVPEDVSIVSYNENPVSVFLGLTTLRLPLRQMARRATELLLLALDEPDTEPETVLLPTELVIRTTCGPSPLV